MTVSPLITAKKVPKIFCALRAQILKSSKCIFNIYKISLNLTKCIFNYGGGLILSPRYSSRSPNSSRAVSILRFFRRLTKYLGSFVFYRIDKVNTFTPNFPTISAKLTQIYLNKIESTAKTVDFEGNNKICQS